MSASMPEPEPQPVRGPISWMARNIVAANLLMLFFLVGGLVTFRSITQEVFPDIQVNVVEVSILYPGASPEEIEQGIVLAVEEALNGLVGIEEITSTSYEGRGSIRQILFRSLVSGQRLAQLLLTGQPVALPQMKQAKM